MSDPENTMEANLSPLTDEEYWAAVGTMAPMFDEDGMPCDGAEGAVDVRE